jgi:ABC-type nitrate/sulfonate/bicarbonate transport system permease component
MLNIFKPFEKVKKSTELTIRIGWLISIISLWVIVGIFGDTHLFPTPIQVITGIKTLWNEGLVVHIFSSLALCGQAVLISVVISLIFCYLSPLPMLKPIAETLSKFRYLPLAGIAFYLAIMISDARALQVWVLVVFMSTFFITSILAVIDEIPAEEFDHARTLGCTRWQALWEVIIKGRFDYVIECIRQNLAIVWMMLISVESMLAAAGGLGFLIKNSDKLGNQGRVIALQIIILLIGIGLDFLLTKGRQLSFRYSKM